MPEKAPGRYWIIRHPSTQGAIVAKFDSMTDADIIPNEIGEHSGFVIQKVADRSALVGKKIDQSGLSEEEKELLSTFYPVR